MQKIIILLVIVLLVCSCSNWVLIRETRRVPASESIEESKSRGAFIFEYEPCSYCLYDSIFINVISAFAEYDCWYADWHTDRIVTNPKSDHLVIQCEEKSYPGYYGDSVTYVTDSTIINWYVESFYSPSVRSFYYLNDSNKHISAPDTLLLLIKEIEQYRGSLYNTNYPNWENIIRKDTIGYLRLIRVH